MTKAEQICLLFRAGSNIDEITAMLECDRSWVLRTLADAGLRTKTCTHLSTVRPENLPPRVSRDPCSYCNVRADIGCRHTRIAA